MIMMSRIRDVFLTRVILSSHHLQWFLIRLTDFLRLFFCSVHQNHLYDSHAFVCRFVFPDLDTRRVSGLF